MKFAYVKKEDIELNFHNGFAQTEMLAGTYQGGVQAFRCALKADATAHPERIKDSLQILFLTAGKGAVLTEDKVFAVNEPAMYVADPDGKFSIHAVSDMTYTMFVVHQAPGDLQRYADFHLAVPFFRPLSQGVEYFQSCKTKHSRSFSLIPTKRLCRVLCGCCTADGSIDNDVQGTIEKGHPAVAQWNVTYGDTDMTLNVDGESVDIKTDDFSYVVAGPDHSLTTKPGKKINYIWFEHYVQEKDYLISYPRA